MNKLLTILLLGIFMLSFASALEWDNQKNYDSKTRTVEIRNSILGIPFLQTDRVATIKLNSELNVEVARGYQKVAEFDLTYYKDENGGLDIMEFFDVKNSMNKIDRQFDYKIKDYETMIVNDYEEICVLIKGNESQECSSKIIGNHSEQRVIWKDFDEKDLIKSNKVTLGIFTDVQKGDKVDWIPTFYGVKIPEWATWTESLNAGLMFYSKLDNASVFDSTGQYTTTNAGSTNTTGAINSGRNFEPSGVGDYIQINGINVATSQKVSYSVWVNTAAEAADNALIGSANGEISAGLAINPNGICFYLDAAGLWGPDNSVCIARPQVKYSEWAHVVGTWNGSEQLIYYNGVLNDSDTWSNTLHSTTNLWLGAQYAAPNSGSALTGDMDELAIYNRSISQSEITQIYEAGLAGFSYTNDFSSNAPSITLNSPSSTNYTTIPSLNINFTASDDVNLINVSMYVNGILNQTNSSGINNSIYLFPLTLADGNYTILGIATDNESQTTNSSSIQINIDGVAPKITIESPTGTLDFGIVGNNETLNVTFTDSNLDACWFNYNGTNTTISGCLTGVKNSTKFILETGNTNMTLYANDTIGNLNSTFISWSYLIENFAVDYNASITEGELDVFSANMTLSGGNTISQAIFEYDSTNYSTSISFSGGKYVIGSSISAPLVSAATNKTFRFYIVVDGVTYSPSSNNQTVLNLDFGTCGGISNDTVMNMSLLDEVARTSMLGDIQINADLISKSSGDTITTLNNTFTNVSSAAICFSPVASYNLYYLDAEIRYEATDYAAEFYFLQKADLGDYPSNLSLYDLKLNSSTEFLVKYQDDNLITVEGAVIQLLRKYLSTGAYEIVEAPLTSNIGTAIMHIDLNTNLYKAIVVKNGIILDTFTNIVFNCENELSGQCTENLFGEVDPQNSEEVTNLNDFSYVVSSVNETITTTFSIPSGTSSSVNIFLKQVDSFGDEYLCNQTVISSAGSIDCSYNKTIGDSRVYLTISKDSEVLVSNGYYIPEDLDLGFAGNNYIIVLVILLTLVGMTFASPEWTVIIGIVAFVLTGSLWLINGMNLVMGLGAMIFILLAAVILIIKMTKQEDQ